MDSTLTAKEIAELRKEARSAEPFPPDHTLLHTFDAEYTPEEKKRMKATIARFILEKEGIPLDE